MSETKKKRNWRAKYLTIVLFQEWIRNDFCHLKKRVNFTFWVSLTILTALLAKLVIDFFWK